MLSERKIYGNMFKKVIYIYMYLYDNNIYNTQEK